MALNTLALLLLVGLAAAFLYFLAVVRPDVLFPISTKSRGDWVAEVGLFWMHGRGSTLYRQRFRTHRGAYIAVRLRAFLLDSVLPTHYIDRDLSGRRVSYEHEYGIHYDVRKVLPSENESFRRIWSPTLPGYTGFSGEHAAAHPGMKTSPQEMGRKVILDSLDT